MNKKRLDWIRSNGGPLICIERGNEHQWLGADGLGTQQNITNNFSNDYEKACGVEDYIGIIEINKGLALVLGDMPLETRVTYRNERTPVIVRIFYAEKDDDVIEKLKSFEFFDEVDSIESINIELNGKEIIIFDSAYRYSEIGNEFLTLDIKAAKYRIYTKLINPDDRTSLLIHEFLQLDA
jgi:hypothetical protein